MTRAPRGSPRPGVEFWYDFASTYSYIAAHKIETAARHAGVKVEWNPFLLGPIFKRQGWDDSPFNLFALKGRYMWRDMERLCAREELPYARPEIFPQNSVLAARVALLGGDEGWCPAFSRGVFRANFADNEDISDAGVLSRLLEELGQPAAAIIERARTLECKERLWRQSERAERRGIFGAPTFVVVGELFWGSDRLDAALDWALQSSPL